MKENNLSGIILDPIFVHSLEMTAYREGFVGDTFAGQGAKVVTMQDIFRDAIGSLGDSTVSFELGDSVISLEGVSEKKLTQRYSKSVRNVYKSKLLWLLTLYEEVNFISHNTFDLQFLIDEGFSTSKKQQKIFDDNYCLDNKLDSDVELSNILSINLLKSNLKQIINIVRLGYLPWFYDVGDADTTLIEKYIEIRILQEFIERNIATEKEEEKYYDLSLHLNWVYDEVNNSISNLINSLNYGHFSMMQNQKHFATPLKYNYLNIGKSHHQIIEDFYYLTKTKLKDEVTILPCPTSIKEVIKLREKKELKRFREILNHWLVLLKNGESTLERKIRKDIKKANKELKYIGKWRVYKESPLNFWINSIGGHIPILSNILTTVNMSAELYSKWSYNRNNWINIAQ